MARKKKIPHWDTPSKRQRREQVEAELAAIPPIDPRLLKLMSAEGFGDYYLQMQDVYPSMREAYERLEDFHITLAGYRRYADFESFRKTLDRRMIRLRGAARK